MIGPDRHYDSAQCSRKALSSAEESPSEQSRMDSYQEANAHETEILVSAVYGENHKHQLGVGEATNSPLSQLLAPKYFTIVIR